MLYVHREVCLRNIVKFMVPNEVNKMSIVKSKYQHVDFSSTQSPIEGKVRRVFTLVLISTDIKS